jgi:PAS domain S-box-containing protein
VFGIPRGTALGYEAFLDMVHPEDRERVDLAGGGALQREPYDVEHRILVGDELKWVRERAALEFDRQGKAVKGIGTVQDITERKRAEEALRLAGIYNRSLIEASLDPLVTIDPEGRITDVNAATEQATGYTRSQLIGTVFSDYFTEPEKARSGYHQVFSEGLVRDYELSIRHRDGRITPVLYNASVYRDEAGNVIGVFAAARDITERKETLRFFQNMYRINRAMQGTNDLEQVMRDVLDAMLSIFDSDRAFLAYPCDPETPSFEAAMERTQTGYPARTGVIPTASDTAKHFQLYLASSGAITLGQGGDYPLETARFGEKSKIMIALYPKTGKPWVLGMHQCSYPRVWSEDEKKLLGEIARRVGDALTSLLAHRDLHESEERHRITLRTAMDGFFRTDMQGRILEVNEAYCRMSGYSEQELLTMAIADVEAMHTAEMITANIRMFEEVGTNRFESVHRRKDGSLFHVEISAQYQPVAGGQIVVFVRDITERKHAEETRLMLAAIVESSDDAIISKDLDGTITSWNKGAERLYGYSAAEVLGRPISIIVPPGQQNEMTGLLKLIREGIRVEHHETERVRKDGRTIPVSVTLSPIKDHRGKIIGASAIVRDISERKRSEEALRRSEAYLAEAQRLSHTGSWAWDVASNMFSYSSEENSRIYGVDKHKDLETEAVLRIVHPEDRDMVKNNHDRSLREKVDTFDEFRIVLPDGTIKHIHAVRHPVMNDAGDVVQLVGTSIDITERKRAEEALQTLMADLESRVEERTKELSKANELLQAANKELESFSYTVSHDLRAPLRAIDGFSKLVLKGYADKLDDEGRRKLNVIRSNAQRMDNLINDLLAFSRLGRKEMLQASVDMEALVWSTWRELAVVNPERRIQFSVQKLPHAMGDQTLIKEVVVNLLTNAAKFSRYRKKAVVEVGAYPEGERNVYFVKDNGVGFDMQYYDKLFGVFQRLHSADEFEGTGVGLAIVERIISRHGGRVWAEGKEDGGATFYFTLTRKE